MNFDLNEILSNFSVNSTIRTYGNGHMNTRGRRCCVKEHREPYPRVFPIKIQCNY